ncbi:MAG: helix-turn-helix domain-containing protein [Planctomycetaceae bacterium]|nr:helix-turn-helix domain-containing protein [Planctomycetaceae bacterium]
MNGYFRLDRGLARRLAGDATLTVKEFRVILALAAATRNPGETVDAPNAFLAAETGLSRTSVQNSRKALMEKGYIVSDHDGAGSVHRSRLAGEGQRALAGGGQGALAPSQALHTKKETRETPAKHFSGSAGDGNGNLEWESYAPDPVFAELAAKLAAERINNG